jgi:hypothetical protein
MIDPLEHQMNALSIAAAKTIDDEITFSLEYERYITNLPQWIRKLSKRRHNELMRSVHRIAHPTQE